MSTDDSAFPHWKGNGMARYTENGPEMIMECTGGLTKRQYAAIHLRVPQSGIEWLDEMIREAQEPTAPAPDLIQAMLNGQQIPEPEPPPLYDDGTRPQPDYYDGEWHEWEGGECPVRNQSGVLVEYRNGEVTEHATWASGYVWVHCRDSRDIIRFRVVKP